MTAKIRKLWKNEYFQTVVVIGLIAIAVFGVWFGSQLVLNTQYPALAVVSGSMCIPQNDRCDGWSHPFSQTLHIGDLIIVQGIAAEDLNSNYPNSDIIVFHKPDNPDELIVHRIVAEEEKNGSIYFLTKGDGNGINKWPTTPSSAEYDPWKTDGVDGVREDLVVGKVVMRIPWLGHIVLFMRNSVGLPIVIALIIIIIIIEFVLPILKGKNPLNNKSRPNKHGFIRKALAISPE